MGNSNKRILDSVHGYIQVSDNLMKNVIDTVYFQRLRRIEQTSTRALFPSARHDRFIHSLGVYHLGHLIIEALKKTEECESFPSNKEVVFNSYELACLLHDIGHSPFSHTFEEYFDNDKHNLSQMLEDEIGNDDFRADSFHFLKKAAPHEKMSAWVVIKAFGNYVQQNADLELVVRMIIGCKYQDEVNKSFENAFIDLIHGDIIDADGLDYVKRDSWASGYSTASIDSERLISAIRVHCGEDGKWQVCYSPKALNEIEAVLAVKTYQQKNVITHHTVVFEQALLKKAMESAAMYHFGYPDTEDKEIRKNALEQLCDVDAYLSEIKLGSSKVPLIYPDDDDFISLMKYTHNDKYVKQWLSRNYEYVPLWKSTAEFFALFPIMHKMLYSSNCWLFSDKCKEFICKETGTNIFDVWSLEATGTDKGVKASKVNFLIDDKVIPYTDIYSDDKNCYEFKAKPFRYIFIHKSLKDQIPSLIGKLRSQVEYHLFG